MDRAKENGGGLKIFMMPWLAYGHISPNLELAKRLTKRNFFIYLCSTPINLQSIAGNLENYFDSIQLVELHLPSSPELPPEFHTTNGLPLHLMNNLKDAFRSSLPNLSDILKKINPDIIVYDIMHPWVGELASSLNILPVDFLIIGATPVAYICHMSKNPDTKYPIRGVYLNEKEKAKYMGNAVSEASNVKNQSLKTERPKNIPRLSLVKSFRELEGETLDYLFALIKKRLFPVGPLVEDHVDKWNAGNSKIIEWLSKKDKCSTVFVSFGSEYYLSKEEMEAIAYGLELSEINFIWVIRFPKTTGGEKIRVEEELPKGFIERVRDRGMIIDGWAPQVEILKHESVGGFLSHCGFGSAIESMKIGVPIIALPMHLDQPLCARLMVQVGIAKEVVRDEMGKIHREEVAKVIRQVVTNKSGEDVRRKAREMKEMLKSRRDEEIDELVKELQRIYEENICGIV